MAAKLIIHIGPPKTGTTALQQALEHVKGPNFMFLGTFQPRDRNAGSFAFHLHRYCKSSVNSSANEFSIISKQIMKILNLNNIAVASEEMILVDQPQADFEKKLQRLSNLQDHIDCQILITTRRPSQALPSLYREIFTGLPLRQKLKFSDFCRSHQALCYNYDYIDQLLTSLGFKARQYVDLEDLSAGDVTLADITGDRSQDPIHLSIDRVNVAPRVRNGSTYVMPIVDAGTVGSAIASALLPQAVWEKAKRSKVLRLTKNAANRLPIVSSRARRLRPPPDVIDNLDRIYEAFRIRQAL